MTTTRLEHIGEETFYIGRGKVRGNLWWGYNPETFDKLYVFADTLSELRRKLTERQCGAHNLARPRT